MTSMNGPSARDSAGAKKDSGTGSDQPVAKAQFLTVAEVAELFGIGLSAAYKAVKAGEIPAIRIGGRILIPTAALRRMLGLEGDS